MSSIFSEHPLTIEEQTNSIAFMEASAGRPETNRERLVISISSGSSLPAVDDIQVLDLKGPLYLQDNSQKYYLATPRDVYSKRGAIQALSSKKMEAIIDFLVDSWHKQNRVSQASANG